MYLIQQPDTCLIRANYSTYLMNMLFSSLTAMWGSSLAVDTDKVPFFFGNFRNLLQFLALMFNLIHFGFELYFNDLNAVLVAFRCVATFAVLVGHICLCRYHWAQLVRGELTQRLFKIYLVILACYIAINAVGSFVDSYYLNTNRVIIFLVYTLPLSVRWVSLIFTFLRAKYSGGDYISNQIIPLRVFAVTFLVLIAVVEVIDSKSPFFADRMFIVCSSFGLVFVFSYYMNHVRRQVGSRKEEKRKRLAAEMASTVGPTLRRIMTPRMSLHLMLEALVAETSPDLVVSPEVAMQPFEEHRGEDEITTMTVSRNGSCDTTTTLMSTTPTTTPKPKGSFRVYDRSSSRVGVSLDMIMSSDCGPTMDTIEEGATGETAEQASSKSIARSAASAAFAVSQFELPLEVGDVEEGDVENQLSMDCAAAGTDDDYREEPYDNYYIVDHNLVDDNTNSNSLSHGDSNSSNNGDSNNSNNGSVNHGHNDKDDPDGKPTPGEEEDDEDEVIRSWRSMVQGKLFAIWVEVSATYLFLALAELSFSLYLSGAQSNLMPRWCEPFGYQSTATFRHAQFLFDYII